ncbi:MAG: DUF1223 domain-containing protein [Bacteroidota bacterium]
MVKKLVQPFAIVVFGILAVLLFWNAKEIPSETTKTAEKIEFSEDVKVVLELFTSQGCSSCPPADKLLAQVQKQYPKEVLALSYHVDYWDYIGWKDPFGSSAYTKKQRAYNRKFRENSNYTPQLVVNGKEHLVGSNARVLAQKLNEYGKQNLENKVTLSAVKKTAGKVDFMYAVSGDLDEKLLRAVLVLDEKTTWVQRGENRNRELQNSHVVAAEKYLELKESKGSLSMAIPALVSKDDAVTLIVLTENEALDITGGTQTKL